jgi:NAD(P)-dependent dehydrogenase (short-subunit alcohol dehydrogenase family)
MMKNLNGKWVLVTAGHVRVGRAISLALAESGANVIIAYGRDRESAKKTLAEVKKSGVEGELFSFDQANLKTVRALFEFSLNISGSLYGLVNNAAVYFKTPLSEVKEEDFDLLLSTNLKGPFFLSQWVGEEMYRQGEGRIVNIADVSAEKAWKDYLPYAVSKSGILTMTKGMAKAFAPRVMVNAVSPGTVLLADEFDSDEERRLIEKTPLKRTGTPEDVASAVIFLLTGNDFINGAEIKVDGGRSIV